MGDTPVTGFYTMRADDECLCGHVRDEHEVSGPCQVDDCSCKRFNLSDWQGDDPDE